MNIENMNINDIEARMGEIRTEMDAPEADIDALTEEVRKLNERKDALKAEAEKRKKLREAVASGQGSTVRAFGSEVEGSRVEYTADSPEYRRAWLKDMAVRDNTHLFGDLTKEERDAFTFLTSNTPSLVPTQIMNRIVELVESNYPMYNDATKSAMTSGFSIPRHKAIVQGDAAAVAEGAANDDEQDTFDLLTLTGVEIKKHLEISRKMSWQSIEAFEDWVVTHISERIGVAKEKRILAQLDNPTYGIDAANVKTNIAMNDAGIRSLFALLKGQGAKVVYANNATIWNGLAGIADGDGTKAFIPSPMTDPVVQGRIYGAAVKLDDNLADNVCYIGIPKYLLANNFETLFINRAIDPKTFKNIVAGYSLFDAGLENPLSFVKVTFIV